MPYMSLQASHKIRNRTLIVDTYTVTGTNTLCANPRWPPTRHSVTAMFCDVPGLS